MDSGTLYLVAGAASAAGSFFAPTEARRPLLFLGAGLALYGIFQRAKAGPTGEALTGEAALPVGAPGLSVADRLLGLLGRATGQEPPVGIATKADRPATEGPTLAPAKNALGVAGIIRDPRDGGTVATPLFADTVAVDAALENQSDTTRAGAVQIRYQGADGSSKFITGPRIDLHPGEFRQVQIRIPASWRSYALFSDPTGQTAFSFTSIALLFDNHTVDKVSFRWDASRLL